MATHSAKHGDLRKHETRVHKHIGKILRRQRQEHGLTQQEVGNELGVTFQQIQKYERDGRISPGKLYLFAQSLNLPVSTFFPQEGVADYAAAPPPMLVHIFRKLSPVALLHTEEVTAIVRALGRISKKAPADE